MTSSPTDCWLSDKREETRCDLARVQKVMAWESVLMQSARQLQLIKPH